jgi:hypothetical protein
MNDQHDRHGKESSISFYLWFISASLFLLLLLLLLVLVL